MTLDAAPSLPLRALGYTRSETLPALHGMHAFAATPARRFALSLGCRLACMACTRTRRRARMQNQEIE